MKKAELLTKIQANPRPVIVEFWAPWCAPCKRMAPGLEKAAAEFAGHVDLWRYNADSDPELVRELGVLGIPTLLVYSGGQETLRRTGMQSDRTLREFFVAAQNGAGAPAPAIASQERILRAGSGLFLSGVAFFAGAAAWPLFIAAGLLVFSAAYDRCPIYQAIAPRVKAHFSRK